MALALALSSNSHAYESSNGRILDANGNTIQLRGLNWFGFDTATHVVHALWMRN